MMTIAQKLPFKLIALDGPAGAFTEPHDVAAALAEAIDAIPDLDRSRLLLFGGCASASRDAGVTMQLVGERLAIHDQFLAVDELTVRDDGSFRVLERIEGGQYRASTCEGPPALLAWATGRLPEPPNNPQTGMANMRTIMPALQQAKPTQLPTGAVRFIDVTRPQERRDTRIVRNAPADDVAREIVEWIKG